MARKDEGFNDGSILWIVFIGLAIMSFFYLGIWGLQSENLRAVALSGIFMGVITMSIVFSKLEIFKLDNSFRQSSLWFTIGFFGWMTITYFTAGRETYSIFALPAQGLFASFSDSLPIFWEFFLTAIAIPVAEESLWLVGLPFLVFWTMNITGNRYKIFKNVWLQIFIACVISGTTFAIFHVGKFFLPFLISAIIFRTILIFLVWGDVKVDAFPFLTIIPSLALGSHIGNNWGQVGFFKGITLMITADGLLKMFGIIVVIGIVFIFLTALDSIFQKVFNVSVGGSLK